MPSTTEPRGGLKYGWELGESGWNEEMDANLKRIGRAAFHLSVKDKDLQQPPGSPDDGDTYIVGLEPFGGWETFEGYIAVWSESDDAWAMYAPRRGWKAHVEDEDKFYYHNGAAWTQLVAAAVLPEGGLAEGRESVAPVSGAVTIDFSVAGVYQITLTEDITSMTLQGAEAGKSSSLTLLLVQDATGGREVAWPASVLWAGPVVQLNADPGAVTAIELVTVDDGTTWVGAAYGGGLSALLAQPNGIATLDNNGKVLMSQLPSLVVTDVFVVADETAQLALTAQEGDVAIRTDESKSYIHNGGSAGTMADWSELGGAAFPEGGIPETMNAPTITSGAITLDFAVAGVFDITLTEDITDMTLQGVESGKACSMTCVLRQDSTGGRTITWPASVTWIGEEIQPDETADSVTIVGLMTTDDGTTWLAFGNTRAAAVADLGLTISATPSQAEVQAISDKVDEVLAALRAANIMAE